MSILDAFISLTFLSLRYLSFMKFYDKPKEISKLLTKSRTEFKIVMTQRFCDEVRRLFAHLFRIRHSNVDSTQFEFVAKNI